MGTQTRLLRTSKGTDTKSKHTGQVFSPAILSEFYGLSISRFAVHSYFFLGSDTVFLKHIEEVTIMEEFSKVVLQ